MAERIENVFKTISFSIKSYGKFSIAIFRMIDRKKKNEQSLLMESGISFYQTCCSDSPQHKNIRYSLLCYTLAD